MNIIDYLNINNDFRNTDKYIQNIFYFFIPNKFIMDNTTITKNDIIKENNIQKRFIFKNLLSTKQFAELIGIRKIDSYYNNDNIIMNLYQSKEKDNLIDDYLYFFEYILYT